MLNFTDVRAGFGGREVLRGVTFSLRPHRFTALIGRNGSGKSTLVSCINGMLPYTGQIEISGRSIALMPERERARMISVLPQFLRSPHISVEELASFGRSPYIDMAKRMSPADNEAIERALEETGMAAQRRRMVDSLSGGERQKAYMAMILAQDTRMIVLDEPTTYMDAAAETAFLSMLCELQRAHKKTLLVIMHDLTEAMRYADDFAILDEGAVCFYGDRQACLDECAIEKTFGVRRFDVRDETGQRSFFAGR